MGYLSAACFVAMILCAVGGSARWALIMCVLGFVTAALSVTGWVG